MDSEICCSRFRPPDVEMVEHECRRVWPDWDDYPPGMQKHMPEHVSGRIRQTKEEIDELVKRFPRGSAPDDFRAPEASVDFPEPTFFRQRQPMPEKELRRIRPPSPGGFDYANLEKYAAPRLDLPSPSSPKFGSPGSASGSPKFGGSAGLGRGLRDDANLGRYGTGAYSGSPNYDYKSPGDLGSHQFDLGGAGARSRLSGGSGSPQFDIGGTGARSRLSGSSGSPQFDVGGAGARSRLSGGSGSPQFDVGAGSRSRLSGGSGSPQFEVGGSPGSVGAARFDYQGGSSAAASPQYAYGGGLASPAGYAGNSPSGIGEDVEPAVGARGKPGFDPVNMRITAAETLEARVLRKQNESMRNTLKQAMEQLEAIKAENKKLLAEIETVEAERRRYQKQQHNLSSNSS